MDRLQNVMHSMVSRSKNSKVAAARASSKEPKRNVAPHPIPKGHEGRPCPMSGLFADDTKASAVHAFAELEADPDIAEERKAFEGKVLQPQNQLATIRQRPEPLNEFVVLNVTNGAHKASSQTRSLVKSIGGLPKLREFTTIFYKRSFADQHIDKLIRSHFDPHGERFATWVVEKFGDGTPWTEERKTRPVQVMKFGSERQQVSFDRSSAHFAAWHSPKREDHKWGQHFKPDDARVWMRLHFWAARETGLFEPQYAAFMDYYIRFIAHFISVYSSKAPPFTRESARWSADPRNIEQYIAAGNFMSGVVDKPVEEALLELPPDERIYTGSRGQPPAWPYGGPHKMTHLD